MGKFRRYKCLTCGVPAYHLVPSGPKVECYCPKCWKKERKRRQDNKLWEKEKYERHAKEKREMLPGLDLE